MDLKFLNVDQSSFLEQCLETFSFQFTNNRIYHDFATLLGKSPDNVVGLEDIPFIPIEFFKNHKVYASKLPHELLFLSSGTTGGFGARSQHFVANKVVYNQSLRQNFIRQFGSSLSLFALLPSYIEQGDSSLVYMVKELGNVEGITFKGFYLNDYERLATDLKLAKANQEHIMLLGVSYALLDFGNEYPVDLSLDIVMETGGMKGRKREMIRSELHEKLSGYFNTPRIHSEYGMTELLSQAYSLGDGIYNCPPWMKVLGRDLYDPFALNICERNAALNIVDLANRYSCSFIATQDVGMVHSNGSFEIKGRIDNADLRGCNLLLN